MNEYQQPTPGSEWFDPRSQKTVRVVGPHLGNTDRVIVAYEYGDDPDVFSGVAYPLPEFYERLKPPPEVVAA